MDCGTYCRKDKEPIALQQKDKVQLVECITKTYSSLMDSYVLFCYPYGIDNETEKACKSINIYDKEEALDKIIENAINKGIIDLRKYFDLD